MYKHVSMYNNDQKELNATEKEILVLKATLEIINSIVNYNILNLHHNDPHSEVRCKTDIHQQYFSIFLVDFLSKLSKDNIFGLNRSNYISLLKDLCSAPVFNEENSIEYLKSPVMDFYNWLETKTIIKEMWFPSINLNIDLILTYSDFLYIGGNISKHNFTKLSVCATKMRKIFEQNNVNKEVTECMLALEDFQNWFHGDGNILGYWSSSIAEFLNNIRWGIHKYLKPEFYRSYTVTKEGKFSYQCPDSISNPFIKNYYYDVMNMAGKEPYMPQFKVSKYLKERY